MQKINQSHAIESKKELKALAALTLNQYKLFWR